MLPRQRRQKDGGLQYCSNNAATPGTPFSTFINLVVHNLVLYAQVLALAAVVTWSAGTSPLGALANFYELLEEAFN